MSSDLGIAPSEMLSGTLVLDNEQTVTSCDEAFCALFGCEPGAIRGRDMDDLFSPRDRRASLEFAKKMTRAGAGVVDVRATLCIAGRDHLARVRVRRRAGGYVAFVEPVGGADDLFFGLTVVEQRWQGLFRSSADAIVILDDDGHILEHNDAFFTMLPLYDSHHVRLSEEAVAGRRLCDVVGNEFPDLERALVDLETSLVAHSAAVIAGRDGKKHAFEHDTRFLELRATPVVLSNRSRLGTFVLIRDIADEMLVEARDAVIQADLTQARAFQRAILSHSDTPPAVDIDVGYRPLHDVGGDVFDVSVPEPDRVRVFVADATGHGVPAALATMLIKSTYDVVKEDARDPAEALRLLDERISTRFRALDVLFTAVVVDLDVRRGVVSHATGGHPAPLLVRGANVVELEAGGAFLGVAPGQTYPRFERALESGDGVYIVTDGLVEARRPEGELFGEARLHEAVRQAGALRLSPCDAVFTRLDAWLRPGRPNDDMTIVSVRTH